MIDRVKGGGLVFAYYPDARVAQDLEVSRGLPGITAFSARSSCESVDGFVSNGAPLSLIRCWASGTAVKPDMKITGNPGLNTARGFREIDAVHAAAEHDVRQQHIGRVIAFQHRQRRGRRCRRRSTLWPSVSS